MTKAGSLFVLLLTLSTRSLLPALDTTARAQTTPDERRFARAREASIAGTRVKAQRMSVINFRRLALEESALPAPTPGPPKVVGPPLPVRHDFPVPDDFVAAPEARLALPAPAATPLGPSPPPSAQFGAVIDNNSIQPPDTNGAVGLNHVMTVTNQDYRVQSKTGANLLAMSVSSFWTGLGASAPFDSKVLYDPYDHRWLITACSDRNSPNSALLIAASQTNNPTGNWNRYMLDVDPSGAAWADYPSFGFNKKWAAVSINMYGVNNFNFSPPLTFLFEKADLYAGVSAPLLTASVINYGITSGQTHVPAVTYDKYIDDLYLVAEWNSGAGLVRQFTISGPVAAPVVSPGPYFRTPGITWHWGTFQDFAPQLGTTAKIMTNDSRMLSVVFRNGSLFAAHTIHLPTQTPLRSAVQWWEFRPTTGTATLTPLQQGRIEDPTADMSVPTGEFFAFPSIAVDRCNHVLIGYTRFSPTQYASVNYAYRFYTDPPGTLRADRVLKAGLGIYDKWGTSRWGDYSSTAVDPVDDVTMWTVQEYAEMPVGTGAASSRWGTWWGQVKRPNYGYVYPCPLQTYYSVERKRRGRRPRR